MPLRNMMRMRELQPYFDKVLLIPAREITTFYGHMNLLGTTSYLDFRVGSQSVPDTNTLLRSAQKLGALVSINHPEGAHRRTLHGLWVDSEDCGGHGTYYWLSRR